MAHSWEEADPWSSDSDDDGSAAFDPNLVTVEEAGNLLADALIDLKLSGAMSAKQVCTIAFWAHKAGAVGPVEDLKWRPDDKSTGHFHRQFDKATGSSLHSAHEFYDVRMPTASRATSDRVMRAVPMLPLHEVLHNEFTDLGLDRVRELLDESRDRLPASYWRHPAVTSAPPGSLVVPVSIYLDSVPFVRHDAVLGIWAYGALFGKHHLVGVLRKSEVCQCSCRGWCTMHCVFQFLRWSFVTMMAGRFPTAGHDGSPFQDTEFNRAERAGGDMGWRGAVVFVKGDWAEIANTLGFSPWNVVQYPCFLCESTRDGLFDYAGLSPVSFPHRLLELADYRGRVARCEIWKTFTQAEAVRIRAVLEFDERPSGVHGRALQIDACGLSKHDRLEPHNGFDDIGRDVPHGVPTLWWRASEEEGVKHRNPMFEPDTGVDPYSTIGIDSLHALSLGVFQNFLASLVAAMVWVDNCWGIRGGAAARMAGSVGRMSQELFVWYGVEARMGRNHTRVQTLTAKMFGKEGKPKAKLHGAETNGVLEFSVSLIARHSGRLTDHERWRTAAVDLVRLKNLLKEHTGRWPAPAIQDQAVASGF
jgi:hypothetical protein